MLNSPLWFGFLAVGAHTVAHPTESPPLPSGHHHRLCISSNQASNDPLSSCWRNLPIEISQNIISQLDAPKQIDLLKDNSLWRANRRLLLEEIIGKTHTAYSDQNQWDQLSTTWLELAPLEIVDSTLFKIDGMSQKTYPAQQRLFTQENINLYCEHWGDFEQFVVANRHQPIISRNARYPLLLDTLLATGTFARTFPLVAGLDGATLIQLWKLYQAGRQQHSGPRETFTSPQPPLPRSSRRPLAAAAVVVATTMAATTTTAAQLTLPLGSLNIHRLNPPLTVPQLLPHVIHRVSYTALWYFYQQGHFADIYRFLEGNTDQVRDPNHPVDYMYYDPRQRNRVAIWARFCLTLAFLKDQPDPETGGGPFIQRLVQIVERHYRLTAPGSVGAGTGTGVGPRSKSETESESESETDAEIGTRVGSFARRHLSHWVCLRFWNFHQAADRLYVLWGSVEWLSAHPIVHHENCRWQILDHPALAFNGQGRLVQLVPETQLQAANDDQQLPPKAMEIPMGSS
ncbi:hypothetical protein BJ085DRAFT_33978 [Dimargaris cristalligena]|uniref:F-box domain-containing protein n=1 Tax=Dimargaris cristalligena TaxID=215637 RepID=A0A4P9ZQH6_9FUNG|nr:hypothetical protein BJ085DRAFT_33978 [Dimargaris cristalligena]|eukprot:RKP35545.1 hypothetical protein BJ085DRAFT_33978 [Dimargaris cristalligena]